jgi:hypothetical protein
MLPKETQEHDPRLVPWHNLAKVWQMDNFTTDLLTKVSLYTTDQAPPSTLRCHSSAIDFSRSNRQIEGRMDKPKQFQQYLAGMEQW